VEHLVVLAIAAEDAVPEVAILNFQYFLIKYPIHTRIISKEMTGMFSTFLFIKKNVYIEVTNKTEFIF